MADMKQVIQAIDANGKVQTVYKKIVDLGGGLYADAVAVNIDTVTVTDVGIKDQVSGNSAGVDVDGNLQVKGDVTATLTGSNMELYGASVGDRPGATDVAAGTTFTIVDDTQEFKTWMANGVDWGEEI